MTTPLLQALADLEPQLLEDDYALLGYERGTAPASPDALSAESFGVRIDDPYETTFVLRTALARTLPPAATEQSPMRLIVLSGELPHDLTGFLSTIAGALAERGIALVPLGAATRDHLLIPAAAWPETLAILRGLRDAARRLAPDGDGPPA